MSDAAEVADLLGPGFTARTIDLRGGAVATLVRHRAPRNTRGAVLYVHGWIDYFFQVHVAEYFAGLGYDFYAVDLRHYGRSLREDHVPYFSTDLSEYDEELDAAAALIAGDGHGRLVVLGHSTGGLIAPLWLADRRDSLPLHPVALILNSPWLELAEPWLMRTVGTWAIRGLARRRPMTVLPRTLGPAYGESIHADHRGLWQYDLAWKPLTGVPVHAGWLAAIRRGQARLHRGLGLDLPVLLLHSGTSRLGLSKWEPAAMGSDTVLDVRQMRQWAPALGPDVTTASIDGAVHDVFLSSPPVQQRAFARMTQWLADHVDPNPDTEAGTSPDSGSDTGPGVGTDTEAGADRP